MKLFRIISLAYLIFSIFYFLLESINPALITTLIAKGIPVTLLIFYLLVNFPFKQREGYLLLAGLLFSLGGDLLLQWSNRSPDFFIYGLLSFLLTQIFYSAYFFSGGQITFRIRPIWPALIILPLYGILLVWWLSPQLGDMLLPVAVYATALVTMGIAGISRLPVGPRNIALLIACGALLFVSSDSLIAINRFGHPFPYSRAVILLTYFMAQYCIVQGALLQRKHNNP